MTTARYQPYMWVSLWEQTYVAWADRSRDAARSGDLGASTSRTAARPSAIGLHVCNSVCSPIRQWPKDHERQAPYLLAAGKWSKGPRSTLNYFESFTEMKTATFAAADPGKLAGYGPAVEGYQGPEARLLLMMCEQLGDSGATKSLVELMADVTDGISMVQDLNKRSGWAITGSPKTIAAKRVSLIPQPAATRPVH